MRRIGPNLFPFLTESIDSHNIGPLAYDPACTATFDDVTDTQCQQWLREKKDKPWLIFWSGGIDSTVIVASVLKNTTPAERENIYIACNRSSMYELPRFFSNHVEPNFQLISTPDLSDYMWYQQYHVIDGEFGDHLYGGGTWRTMQQLFPHSMLASIRRHPALAIHCLAVCTKTSNAFAGWYFEHMLNNIDQSGVPIDTYHDFFWWIFFNYHYGAVYVRRKVNNICYNHAQAWYGTNAYQQWAMNHNLVGIKYTQEIGGHKLASKQYIYDFDRDPYALTFRFKSKSIQYDKSSGSGFFCVLDDFSQLHLDRDLNLILQLLPDHIVA